MLTTNFPCVKSAFVRSNRAIFRDQNWVPLFIFVLLLGASHGIAAANSPTHFNFFRSTLRGRQRVLTCAKDPSVCLNREKNPWGGSTCCFQRFCKDTRTDTNHCGRCGKTCTFGLVCCDGNCVDIQNDPRHCGACFEACSGQTKCAHGMCDYGR